MVRLVLSFLLAGAVLAGVASPTSSARADDHHKDRERVRRWVPEFSPATAGAVAALLAGGGILLLRRKKK